MKEVVMDEVSVTTSVLGDLKLNATNVVKHQ
jgi:hypothetical protein